MNYLDLVPLVVNTHTVAEGEAVDERQAVEPVVVLGVAHREKSRPVPQEGALEPGWDGACRLKVM